MSTPKRLDPNHDLASVSEFGMGKLNIASSMGLEEVTPEGVIWRFPNCTVSWQIETSLVFCAVKEEIGVIKGSFDVRVVSSTIFTLQGMSFITSSYLRVQASQDVR